MLKVNLTFYTIHSYEIAFFLFFLKKKRKKWEKQNLLLSMWMQRKF